MYFRKILSRIAPISIAVYLNSSQVFLDNRNTTADVCEKVLPGVFRILIVDPRTNALVGVGSGFFIKPDGTALTASHVLAPGFKYIAKLDNGEEHEAHVYKEHKLTDIALVKVNTDSKVPVIPLGDSSVLRRGEQVIHIGSSLYSKSNDIDIGYINKVKDDTPSYSVILGDKPKPESGLDFIMTTGSVRPGFSGGPLVNMDGQVVGLISRIQVMGHQAGTEIEGKSIPINFVKNVIKQLEISGKVERPYIGLSFTPSLPGLAIVRVQPGSPAEKAGLKVGDILVTADNQEMNTPDDFYRVIGYKIGIVLKVTVVRDKETLNLKIST